MGRGLDSQAVSPRHRMIAHQKLESNLFLGHVLVQGTAMEAKLLQGGQIGGVAGGQAGCS